MRSIILLVIVHACISYGQQQPECVVKYNVTSGDQRINTCELNNVRFNLMNKPLQLKSSNVTKILESTNIRVKFINSEVQAIPSSIFEQLRQIEMLEMGNVGLRNILQKSFENALFLKVFDAHENKLVSLSSFIFQDAQNLEVLDLSSNVISNVNHQAFAGLSKLIRLSLSDNKISIIDEETFEPLENLRWLWLDRNEIKIVSLNHLVKNQNLVGIYLNNNKISALSPILFDQIPELNYLFLAGNNCTNQNFINQKIMRNSNVKKELATCFKEFRTIVPDETQKHGLNSILDETKSINKKCEEEKAVLLGQIEEAKKRLVETKGKN